MHEDLNLHAGLVLEFLLVPYDLKGYVLFSLVVKALQALAEGAFAEEL